jgi:hypothetical protein
MAQIRQRPIDSVSESARPGDSSKTCGLEIEGLRGNVGVGDASGSLSDDVRNSMSHAYRPPR